MIALHRRFLGCVLWLAFAADGQLPASTNWVAELPSNALYLPGRFVYQRNCLVCHGRYGDGQGEMSVGMFPKPRPFTSGTFKYRSTPWGYLPTNEDLFRTIRGGLAGTSMPAFTTLTDRETRSVVEYIKSFSSKWRHRENYAAPFPLAPLPEWFGRAGEFQRRAERGKALFQTACAACHGAVGDGQGPAAPTLRDGWDQWCPPADLRNPTLRRGSDLREVYRTLVTGMSGTPMPSFAETLTADQRWELVAHIATLREPESGNATGTNAD